MFLQSWDDCADLMAKPDSNLDSAVALLNRGDELLADKQYSESYECLSNGLETLLNIIKGELVIVFIFRYYNIVKFICQEQNLTWTAIT